MLAALTILYGAVVGFSLGLTGGGGSVFAVPLLVYGLGLGAHRAVCASMVAVGTTAAVGAMRRLRTGEVDVATALIVAFAGFIGAPVGAWLGRFLEEKWLLVLFAGIVVIVAFRMLFRAATPPSGHAAIRASLTQMENREAPGWPSLRELALPPGRATALMSAGVLTGLLSGLLGIGGGFIIVPVLVIFRGLEIHRAIATSLLVIALVSISAVASHLLAGQRLPVGTTALFTIGGVLGLRLGSMLGERLSGVTLQKVFAVAMFLMAGFMVVHNLGLI